MCQRTARGHGCSAEKPLIVCNPAERSGGSGRAFGNASPRPSSDGGAASALVRVRSADTGGLTQVRAI